MTTWLGAAPVGSGVTESIVLVVAAQPESPTPRASNPSEERLRRDHLPRWWDALSFAVIEPVSKPAILPQLPHRGAFPKRASRVRFRPCTYERLLPIIVTSLSGRRMRRFG
jgi:hypothetical protein